MHMFTYMLINKFTCIVFKFDNYYDRKKNYFFLIKNWQQKFIYSLPILYRISRNALGQYFFFK